MASGSSFASGSGARNAASPPSGTTTGESGSDAATRAASLLDATPQRAGRDSTLRGGDERAAEVALVGEEAREAVHVHPGEALAAVLDARRDRAGRVEQRLLRGALARGVARAGEEVREERARLRQREAGADAGAPRLARGGDDARGRAVALADGDGLVGERRLAAQPRGEGEEGHDETGKAHDEKKISLLRISEFGIRIRISLKVNTPGRGGVSSWRRPARQPQPSPLHLLRKSSSSLRSLRTFPH